MHESPLVPDESRLPIDPSTDVPIDYTPSQRGQPNGFIADPDVMDTWATSSMTPQIAGLWEDDNALFRHIFPMDLRPQGHDIIRTWLFSTTVRSHFEFNVSPWKNVSLSGWILDPDRKKMSKSKGNVVTPIDLFDSYGSDAVRYWAASARPGVDTAFSEDQMKVGRKLATKLLNATKFVLSFGDIDKTAVPTAEIDVAMLARLSKVVAETTTAFEQFDYARALERTEEFFWWFCDDYVELVKMRAYANRGDDQAMSARVALQRALSTLQRLFAPFIPFATEEVWNWWNDSSVHLAPWPTDQDLMAGITQASDDAVLNAVCSTIAFVRRTKTEAKVSQRAEVEHLTISGDAGTLRAVKAGLSDIEDAGSVKSTEFIEISGAELTIDVRLVAPNV